jgi:predicted DNA-binding protein
MRGIRESGSARCYGISAYMQAEGTVVTKAMSLRLPEDLAAELAAVAAADEMPISEAVREAIDKHIAARRADKDFQERLKKRLEQNREILERLTE